MGYFFSITHVRISLTSYLQTSSSYGISLLGLILRPYLQTLLQRFNHRFDLRLQINLYVTEIVFDVFSKFGR